MHPVLLPALLTCNDISNPPQASSAGALAFLESLGLDLSATVRLGGHSAPRTRSNPAGPNVGFALIRALEGAVKQQPNVRIVTSARVSGGGIHCKVQFLINFVATQIASGRMPVEASSRHLPACMPTFIHPRHRHLARSLPGHLCCLCC